VDAGQMVQELLMEEDEVSALTMQHDECFEIPVVCRWVERMSDALLFGCRCLLNHPDTRHEFQRHRNRYIVFTHFLVIILLPALRSRIRISEAGSDKYMHEIHAAMKTPLLLPSPPHSWPLSLHVSESFELACEAQNRNGRLSPTLPAENGNLFLDHSRLHPCHSTRFVAIEHRALDEIRIINTYVLSQFITAWELRSSRYRYLFLELFWRVWPPVERLRDAASDSIIISSSFRGVHTSLARQNTRHHSLVPRS
jgi:hypothetical protein